VRCAGVRVGVGDGTGVAGVAGVLLVMMSEPQVLERLVVTTWQCDKTTIGNPMGRKQQTRASRAGKTANLKHGIVFVG
jgi:hypothetical protein